MSIRGSTANLRRTNNLITQQRSHTPLRKATKGYYFGVYGPNEGYTPMEDSVYESKSIGPILNGMMGMLFVVFTFMAVWM